MLLRGPVGGFEPGRGWLKPVRGEPLAKPLGCEGGEAPEAEYLDESSADLSMTGLSGRSLSDSQFALLDAVTAVPSEKEGFLAAAPSDVAGLVWRDKASDPPLPSSTRLGAAGFGGVKERSLEGGV